MMERQNISVVVVGCGVSGLTCGIRLLEEGFKDVTIMARDLSPNTTSDIAGAIWSGHDFYQGERTVQWGKVALEKFYQLARTQKCGVSLVPFTELFENSMDEDPWWKDKLPIQKFRHVPPANLPPGYQDGYTMEVPLIEMPIYMPWLRMRFERLGGTVRQGAIVTLSDLYKEDRLVVNCTGLGARELVGDYKVYPVRGQIVIVRAQGIEQWIAVQSGNTLTYIFPRPQSNDCVLGGTAEYNDWTREVNPQTAVEILERCTRLNPALLGAEVLTHKVGLRPWRKEVRLEYEWVFPLGRCAIVHNYGHAGAGVTLSWGCAEEVVMLATQWA